MDGGAVVATAAKGVEGRGAEGRGADVVGAVVVMGADPARLCAHEYHNEKKFTIS